MKLKPREEIMLFILISIVVTWQFINIVFPGLIFDPIMSIVKYVRSGWEAPAIAITVERISLLDLYVTSLPLLKSSQSV